MQLDGFDVNRFHDKVKGKEKSNMEEVQRSKARAGCFSFFFFVNNLSQLLRRCIA